jgi:hypothetical protein
MRLLFLIALLLFTSNTVFSRVLYVKGKITSDTLNNGSSWRHAFIDLQPAMHAAVAGDTIKVSEGMYGGIGFSKDSITLLGGYSFTNGDTTDAKRNWAAYPTKLFGANPDPMLVRGLIGVTVLDGFVISRTAWDDIGMKIENTSNFIIRNSIFENHFYCALQIINSSVSIVNCVFTNNAYAVLASANSATVIVNSVFTYNGRYNLSPVSNTNSNLSLINCTMVGNNGVFFYGTGTGTSNIRNSIFSNNYARGNGSYSSFTERGDIEVNGHQLTINNCITQTYTNASTGRLLTAFNPRFVNIANPAGPDNRYFTADDGLQLSIPCSPALNSGDNSFVNTISTDILGQPRVFNAGTVDMGAYERQSIPGNTLKTVFVKNTGNTGNNDGSSWQNAFPTLQDALLYCADTIKIAEGTYLTTNSRSDSIFYLENKKVLIGGYPAFGNPSDDNRNPSVYISRLEGTFSPTVLTTMRSPVLKLYHTDSTTIIDGISFSNGYIDPTTGDVPDALLIDFNSNPVIKNCNFLVNPAKGIFKTGVSIHGQSAPTFLNSQFSAYGSYRGGNAISCTENSTLTIRNSFFLGDSTGIRNTINAKLVISINLTNSTLVMDSTLFWKVPYSGVGNFILSNNSILNIKSCVFRDFLTNGESHIRNTNSTTGTISNCSFRNLHSGSLADRALIYNDKSSVVFNHCLFDSARLVVENFNRSAPVFNNCVSINAPFMTNNKSFPTINNSTIINTSVSSSKAQGELITIRDSTTVRANNSIFWTLKQTGGKQEILNEGLGGASTVIFTNCITRTFGTNGENGNMVGENPRFAQLNDIDGPDNIMFTADDGLQLANCSPAINSGTATPFSSSDILKQPRVFNNVIDIGAYEFQGQPDLTNSYYVNAESTGNNSGVSWTNAYKTMQSAVCNVCADTIRVAAGIYHPATTTRDSAFYIDRPITMLGGYPASGNPSDNLRNSDLNQTIIDGNIGDPLDSLDNSRTLMIIVGTKDSVVIDGFTFRNGLSSTGGIQINAASSGGIYTYNNHTVIRNCNFFSNAARYGGAISIRPLTTCKITRSLFINNTASNAGGAIDFSGDSLIISNTVFEKNNSLFQGGAIKIEAGFFNINNTVLYQNSTSINSALGSGGAIWAGTNQSIGSINNCTFRENKTLSSLANGGGLCTEDQLRTIVRNCIFSGNATGNSGQGNYPDMDWSGNYNTVFQTILQKPRSYTSPLKILYTSGNFIDSLNPKGLDKKWMTADDGLAPNYNSAAINFGDNMPVINLPFDLAYAARIIGDTVDLGAYEYQNLPIANAGNDTSICIGTFAEIGKPGNPKHTYKWSSDPIGFTSSSIMPQVNPSTITTYFLEVSNGFQTTKDSVTVTPLSTLTSSITITASATFICQGSNVLFTSTNLHGGASPSYQWQVNGLPVGTNQPTFSSSTLNNGDKVSVIMTSSSNCSSPIVTSNTITINVTPLLTPSVSMTIGPTPVCTGDTVTVVATAVNGGSLPLYRLVIGGVVYQTGRSSTFKVPTSSFTSGSQFYVTLTSNETCVTAPTVSSSLTSVVTNPSITASAQISGNTTVLAGQLSYVGTMLINGGTQPSFQWQESLSVDNWQNIANATGPTINYLPIATGHRLRCIVTSNAFCARPQSVVSNTLSYIVNMPTGLNNNILSNSVKLYPNPASNFIVLDSLNLNDRWESSMIIGINSRQYSNKIFINNTTRVKIETNHLAPGLYFVVLQNKEGKKIHLKFVKL